MVQYLNSFNMINSYINIRHYYFYCKINEKCELVIFQKIQVQVKIYHMLQGGNFIQVLTHTFF
jgi:hypothetical protein